MQISNFIRILPVAAESLHDEANSRFFFCSFANALETDAKYVIICVRNELLLFGLGNTSGV